MIVIGIDAHKRSHTAVAVDERSRKLAEKTTGTTPAHHRELLSWAQELGGGEVLWAIEDVRHLSRQLEIDLLVAGQSVVRVPTKLMAHARDFARTYGKSDPIDALAVARAALREPNLPTARLDGPERDLRLLVDHREDLVNERTRICNRLHWHLHELDPSKDVGDKMLGRYRVLDELTAWLGSQSRSTVRRIAAELVDDIRRLTIRIKDLEKEITAMVNNMAPTLVGLDGIGALSAAKILGEVAGIDRFDDKAKFAAHNGTAPMPVWSSNNVRVRLRRTGNRQLNCAIHRMAITQMRMNNEAKAYLEKRMANGNTKTEAIRSLKRRLSDVVYRALTTDSNQQASTTPVAA